MFISIQTICTCHGYLLFESLHCERCRSLIPFQLTDESLLDPVSTNNITNEINIDNQSKPPLGILVPYRKQQQKPTTTGRVRFRILCPFCNSTTFIIRYYCKRERLYYHLRMQNHGENELNMYRSIADTQNMITVDEYGIKRDLLEELPIKANDNSYSLRSSSQSVPSTVIYDQKGISNMRDKQIENERNLHGFNELEGDLFSVLRNGLFYDTLIQCQDDVKIQVHRCILGGRSSWFRHLISEYHESNTHDDYILQITIDDIHSEIMNEILSFMYTNRCFISLRNAPDLLIAAKRFELEKLKVQIADFLLYRLTLDNAIEMLICAHEAGSEALKLACIRLINRNAEKIKRTEKWRTFKKQYVDLVPELYENRVEHPTTTPQAFLPDVFTAPAFPSESLRSLSQLYEDPVQRQPRSLHTPSKLRQRGAPHILKSVQLVPPNEVGTDIPAGSYTHRSNLYPPRVMNPNISGRQGTMNNRRRSVPFITRTVLPNIRQDSGIDAYRRPVNVYGSNHTIPVHNQRDGYSNAPPKAPSQSKRSVSPKYSHQIIRSPPITNTRVGDDTTSTKIVNIEPSN